MNKHERIQAGRKKAERQARKVGWTGAFKDLPAETQEAFIKGKLGSGGKVSDRKGFSRSKRPLRRGTLHIPAKMARQRADLRQSWADSGVIPSNNKMQRELGRFVKKPKKNLNADCRTLVQGRDYHNEEVEHPVGSGEHDVVLDAIWEHITGEALDL